jgi:hypothetical protein
MSLTARLLRSNRVIPQACRHHPHTHKSSDCGDNTCRHHQPTRFSTVPSGEHASTHGTHEVEKHLLSGNGCPDQTTGISATIILSHSISTLASNTRIQTIDPPRWSTSQLHTLSHKLKRDGKLSCAMEPP